MIRTNRHRPRLRGFWMKVRDGAAVRRWRIQAALTQAELATLCKCSQTTIHMIESGKLTSITEALAMNISRRLRVPLEDLFLAQGDIPAGHVVNGADTKGKVKARL